MKKTTFFFLIGVLLLHFFWAATWPILNDESYYWDWSRNLQLSYVDAPPAIAWVSFVGSHLLHGNFSARVLVPFLYFFSAIFLIKSADILAIKKNLDPVVKPRDDGLLRDDTTESSIIVLILFFCIPIFNLYGVLLQPDAPLFFACTGTLYFALKSCEKYILEKKESLSLAHACGLGVFIGLGIVSKYQASPLALGIFFAIMCLRGVKQTFQKDISFWIVTVFMALVVSSPLFIWNIQNDFASFKFQGQHGFSTWHFNLLKFILYLIAIIFVILPWYFYLFWKQIKISLKKENFLKSLDVIPLFAFFSIFIFIASSALGKMAKVHWITPSFLFLIPLVATNWDFLTKKNQKFWKRIHIVSGSLIIIFFSLSFANFFQNFLGNNQTPFAPVTKKIQNGLFAGMIWSALDHPAQTFQEEVPGFNLVEKSYFSNLEEVKCTQEPYLATFHWRWASQMAFYLTNHPRVFVLNLSRSTYYSWRDPFQLIAGCRIFVIGEKRQYRENELREIMNIRSVKEFTIQKRYSNDLLSMVFIDGTMKEADKLQKVTFDLLQAAPY